MIDHRYKLGEKDLKQQLQRDYNKQVHEYKRLVMAARIAKDPVRKHALDRRVREKSDMIQKFQSAVLHKYPNTKFK